MHWRRDIWYIMRSEHNHQLSVYIQKQLYLLNTTVKIWKWTLLFAVFSSLGEPPWSWWGKEIGVIHINWYLSAILVSFEGTPAWRLQRTGIRGIFFCYETIIYHSMGCKQWHYYFFYHSDYSDRKRLSMNISCAYFPCRNMLHFKTKNLIELKTYYMQSCSWKICCVENLSLVL